jgi:hypothetical protein
LVGFTAPFWHIFYGINDNEGLCGYAYMSSFLFAIGNRVFTLCFSLLFVMASFRIEDQFKMVFRRVALMGVLVSLFFIFQILISKKLLMQTFGINDLHVGFYYAAMVLMAILSGAVFVWFGKAVMYTEQQLKAAIKVFWKFVISQRFRVINLNDYERDTEALAYKIDELTD